MNALFSASKTPSRKTHQLLPTILSSTSQCSWTSLNPTQPRSLTALGQHPPLKGILLTLSRFLTNTTGLQSKTTASATTSAHKEEPCLATQPPQMCFSNPRHTHPSPLSHLHAFPLHCRAKHPPQHSQPNKWQAFPRSRPNNPQPQAMHNSNTASRQLLWLTSARTAAYSPQHSQSAHMLAPICSLSPRGNRSQTNAATTTKSRHRSLPENTTILCAKHLFSQTDAQHTKTSLSPGIY